MAKTGLTHGITAGVKAWWENKDATVLTGVAGAIMQTRAKHYQLEQLALEVNDALHYIGSVKKWVAKVHTCETHWIEEQVVVLEAYMQDNFLGTHSFLQNMMDLDRRAMQVLKEASKDPEEGVRAAQRVQLDTFLELWPEHYRTDLNARMLRLVEVMKESMMDSMMNGDGAAVPPGVCELRRPVVAALRVGQAPMGSGRRK
jgi:hypothetical protein